MNLLFAEYTNIDHLHTARIMLDTFISSLVVLRYRSNWQILHNRIISFIVLSSDNTNCKNDIQLFHQLFDELSVYRDYH